MWPSYSLRHVGHTIDDVTTASPPAVAPARAWRGADWRTRGRGVTGRGGGGAAAGSGRASRARRRRTTTIAASAIRTATRSTITESSAISVTEVDPLAAARA